MALVFTNLKLLVEDMKFKNWSISGFEFTYKHITYMVLVRLFVKGITKKDEFALAQLQFMKKSKIEESLIVEANRTGFLPHKDKKKKQEIREYFGIEWSNYLGDALKQLETCFNQQMINEVPEVYSKELVRAMVSSLSKSDSENPNKLYCGKVKRNPHGYKRSIFNTDKTRLLRKNLYKYFKDNFDVSFCYFEEPDMEKTDEEIIEQFIKTS